MGQWTDYLSKMVNRVGSKSGGQWWDYLIGGVQGVGDILIDKYEVEPQRKKQEEAEKAWKGPGIISAARQAPRMSR